MIQQLAARLGLHPSQQTLMGFWLKLIGLATLILDYGFDLPVQAAKFHITITPTWNGLIYIAAFLIVYFSSHDTDSSWRPPSSNVNVNSLTHAWLLPITLAVALPALGCFSVTPHQLSPAEVIAIFDAAQWGVKEAVMLEYLSPADGQLFADVVTTVQAAIAKNPSAAIEAGLKAAQEAEAKLPADSKVRPYIDGAVALLQRPAPPT